uniref:BZIP domain-containing protein n=1 Tax=Kalanchoe fedtschenkoi TaxID=63787 RepID=A0A7N0TMJ8_KALFE
MLSAAAPARSESQADPKFGFSDSEFDSWDFYFHDLVFEPEPICSNPMSTESNQNSPNSIELNQGSPVSPESNQIWFKPVEPTNEPGALDDRKVKRMKSNRESARRSRMRKQQHLDNLRNQVNRLNLTNRELSDRLRFVLFNGKIVRSENQRLRTEHTLLRHRLIQLQNLMIFRGVQRMNNHNNNTISSNYFDNLGGYEQTMINEPTRLIA